MVVAEYPTKYMDAILYRNITVKSPMPAGKSLYERHNIVNHYSYQSSGFTSFTMTVSSSDADAITGTLAPQTELDRSKLNYAFNSTNGQYSFTGTGTTRAITLQYLCFQRSGSNWYNIIGGLVILNAYKNELWDTAYLTVGTNYNGVNVESYDVSCKRRKSSKYVSSKTCGEYVDTIFADEGSYPDDGISGSYWYVRVA